MFSVTVKGQRETIMVVWSDFWHNKGHLPTLEVTHIFMNIGFVVSILNILSMSSKCKRYEKGASQGGKNRRIWSPAIRIETRNRWPCSSKLLWEVGKSFEQQEDKQGQRDENFHLREQRPSRILILREWPNTDYDSKNGEMQTKVYNLSC